MTRNEQVQRAKWITQKMRAEAVKPGGKPKRSLPVWQVDARDELARLVGAEKKQADDDAPPEREE